MFKPSEVYLGILFALTACSRKTMDFILKCTLETGSGYGRRNAFRDAQAAM